MLTSIVSQFSCTPSEFLVTASIAHTVGPRLVPPQIVLLCKSEAVKKYDFSHVKLCMSGAAPLSGGLYASVKQIFPNATIGQSYGKLPLF
jgi:hypothetical protein